FGGFDGRFYQGGTWQWTGTSWAELHPTNSPNAKGAGIAALDPVHHNAVLFGGLASVNPFGTWLWDGVDWNRAGVEVEPPLTYYSSATYDPRLGGVVSFGGAAGGPDLNDAY